MQLQPSLEDSRIDTPRQAVQVVEALHKGGGLLDDATAAAAGDYTAAAAAAGRRT